MNLATRKQRSSSIFLVLVVAPCFIVYRYSQVGSDVVRQPLILPFQDDDIVSRSKEPLSQKIDAPTTTLGLTPTAMAKTSVECNMHNCRITNACLDSEMREGYDDGARYIIRVFGDSGSSNYVRDYLLNHINKTSSPLDSTVFDIDRIDNTTALPESIYANRTAAIGRRFIHRNCGHALGDDIVPIFRSLRLFRAPSTKLAHVYLKTKMKLQCDQLFRPLISNDMIFFKRNKPPSMQCYSHIYIGFKGFGFMSESGVSKERLPTMQSDFMAFRNTYYKYQEEVMGHWEQEPHAVDTILVMRKESGAHLANFENRDEMVETLHRHFPSYTTRVVTWANMDVAQQIQLLRRSRAIISLPGADTLNAILLPDNSALVIYCRPRNTGKNIYLDDAYNDVHHWFRHLSYFNTTVEECDSKNVSYNYTTLNTKLESMDAFVERLEKLGLQSSRKHK